MLHYTANMVFIYVPWMAFTVFLLLCGIIGFVTALHYDVSRRKLSLTRVAGWNFATLLDVLCIAVTVGLDSVLLAAAPQFPPSLGRLVSPVTAAIIASLASLFFLWPEGRRQVQIQRP